MAIDGGVFFRFLIAALATWRVAFMLARERGPWDVFGRVRRGAGRGLAGELLKCVKCVALWVAVPFAFFVRGDWWEVLVIWLGAGRRRGVDRRVDAPAVRVAGKRGGWAGGARGEPRK